MLLREKRPEKDDGPGDPKKKRKQAEGPAGEVKIRCPRCGWNHDWRPHWGCELCGSVFDTFVTKAHCPNATCGNSWKLTWCPVCGDPSPHVDWYVRSGIGPGGDARG